ncbi:TRADD-N-associated membrane domain-containing protein [Nocardia abscessus]|uniref:TRADD-N-associated membrane domain-containing protein n=1 Tax=Nocardia abscessus TaxID=120957 RepID=UPI002457D7FF|nr:hypothetical protein [Nocardia abscessus]
MFKETDKGFSVTGTTSDLQFHWAATYKMARRRCNILAIIGGLVLMTAFAIFFAGYFGAGFGRYYYTAKVLDISLFGIGIVLLFGAILSYFESYSNWAQLIRSAISGELAKSVEDIEGVDDLMGLMLANRKQMDAYDAIVRSQGSSSHRASLGAMAAGLIMVSVGLSVALLANESSTKYSAALIAATGTVTGGFIAQTFIRVQKSAQDQMRYYFQQPLVHSYLLTAERLAVQLPPEVRAERYQLLIDTALDQARNVTGWHPLAPSSTVEWSNEATMENE